MTTRRDAALLFRNPVHHGELLDALRDMGAQVQSEQLDEAMKLLARREK